MSLTLLRGEVASRSIIISNFLLYCFSDNIKACLMASPLQALSFAKYLGLLIKKTFLFFFFIFLIFLLSVETVI